MRPFTTFLICAAAVGQTVAPGFTDSLVGRVPAPTTITPLPDGRILVGSQGGVLRILRDDQLLPTPALTIPTASICSNSERGLLGVARDPAFDLNGYVYIFYTHRAPGRDCASGANAPVNRVSRVTMRGDSIDMSSELVLIDNISSFNGNHNAGDLQFGNDGLLYVATGDAGCHYGGGGRCAGQNDAARETHHLLGKILRIGRDGSIPPSNPWQGPGTARCNTGPAAPGTRCQETYSWGLRNPFRFGVDPNFDASRIFINDVGQDRWEEINEAAPGANFGWNVREGFCQNGSSTQCAPTSPTPAGLTDPVFAYPHDIAFPGTSARGCNSIAGGAFVPNGFWPERFDGAYIFADFVCGALFSLVRDGEAFRAADFDMGLGNNTAVTTTFAPFNGTIALYYTTYAGGGQVRRITASGIRASIVSAAAFQAGAPLAPESLVALFAADMPSVTAIRIRDARGREFRVSLIFTGEIQANFALPAELAPGLATVTAFAGTRVLGSASVRVQRSAPSIFTVNSSGSGPAAAQFVRNGDRLFLILYGTGIRGRSSLSAVRVRLGSVDLAVDYAGPQLQFAGLDQINVPLPASLAGSLPLTLTVDGVESNRVTILIPN